MYTIGDLFDKRSIVGSKLEKIFEQCGYSKAQICRESGVSRPTMDKLLCGTLTSKVNYEKHIAKVLEFLAITPDTLLGQIQNKNIRARAFRNVLHISSEEIARNTGISKVRLEQIESGEEATTAELRDIALALSTGVRNILGTSCFDTQIATMEMVLTVYAEEAASVGLSGFWGHIGILPCNTEEYLWYPITGSTRRMIYESMEMERVVIPCMNNKVLLLNMQNIKEIVLLDDACDEPSFGNWDASVDCGEIPLVIYEALYDYNYPSGPISDKVLSSRFQSELEEFLARENWDDSDIYKRLYETAIYFNDGHIKKVSIDFCDDETITCEVFQVINFGDEAPASKVHYCSASDGSEVILNMQNIALLAMPLLEVEEAICSSLEDLLG